jgi:hypothetical protein
VDVGVTRKKRRRRRRPHSPDRSEAALNSIHASVLAGMSPTLDRCGWLPHTVVIAFTESSEWF